MSARSIFVLVMLALVIALFFYLFAALGTKLEDKDAVEQTPIAEDDARPSSGVVVQTTTEADSRLEELKKQQGAASSEGLSRLYLVKCSACHGRDGRGPIGSPIAGKSKEENMAALMKYKMKQVPNSAMLGLLEQTSDEELEMLAEEISAF